MGDWYDLKNIGEDYAEYQRLSAVLKERMPSLESFLEMKYNDKNTYQTVLDEYEIGHMYEVQGDVTATKVLEMDQVAFDEKRHGFDVSAVPNATGKTAKKIKNLATGGNAALMEIDGQLYFSHSRVRIPGTIEFDSYIGDTPLVGISMKPIFKVLDLNDGIPRQNDTEAKFLEYVASIKPDTNEAFTVTILSEKHICKSCLFVVEQFKARYPNATINIASGNPSYGEYNSKGEMGMLHWQHRKEEK